jgi:YD repeat-containing protein
LGDTDYVSADDHTLLNFDVADTLPTHVQVLLAYAVLTLTSESNTTPEDVGVWQAGKAWSNAATWNSYDGTHAWTTPGGDTTGDLSDTLSIGTNTDVGNQFYWDIDSAAEGWGDGQNNGLIFAPTDPSAATNRLGFATEADEDNSPYVAILYEPRMGAYPGAPYDSRQLSDGSSVRANIANGNLELSHTDVHVTGMHGLPLNIGRYYNNFSSDQTSFGLGWSMGGAADDALFLPFDDRNTIDYVDGTGNAEMFHTDVSGNWVDPAGGDAAIAMNDSSTWSSGTFTLTLPDQGLTKTYTKPENSLGVWAQLQSISNSQGDTISYSYGSDGRLDHIVDTRGGTTSLQYSAAGYVSAITDPRGAVYSYTQDSAGNLTAYTDPAGDTTTYAYDSYGDLTEIDTPDGSVLTPHYDAGGTNQLDSIETQPAAGTATTTTYDYTPPSGACPATAGWAQGTIDQGQSDARTFCTDDRSRLASSDPPSLMISGGLVSAADSDLTDDTYDLHAVATDSSPTNPNLGITSLAITVDGNPASGFPLTQDCPNGGCSLSTDWSFNTADYGSGTHTVTVTATDANGSTSSRSVSVAIAYQPTVALSGAAWDSPIQNSTTGTLALHVAATEPTSANSSGPTPGVVAIATTVNGQAYPNGPTAQQSCPQGTCSLSADGSIDLSDLNPGDNSVEVDVTDAAGAVTPTEWSIFVQGAEDADTQDAAAQSLEDEHGISASAAFSRLAIQDAAIPVLDNVEAAIGSSATGDEWFDDATGRLEIGVVSSANPPAGANVDNAKAILTQAGIQDSSDFVNVAFTTSQLEDTQATIDQDLSDLEDSGAIRTGIDPATNSVDLTEADDLTSAQDGVVADAISAAGGTTDGSPGLVPVVTTLESSNNVGVEPEACGFNRPRGEGSRNWVTCDPTLRGSVAINDAFENGGACTLGFPARGTGAQPNGVPNNRRVVLTAGHCLYYSELESIDNRLPKWYTYDAHGHRRLLRDTRGQFGYEFGNGETKGDWGFLEIADTDYWQPHSDIYAGSGRPDYAIARDGSVKKGETVCMTSGPPLATRAGGPSDATANKHQACGHVIDPDVSAEGPPAPDSHRPQHLVMTSITTTVSGSSGSPVYLNHTAFGLESGSTRDGHHYMVYQPIRSAEKASGTAVFGF